MKAASKEFNRLFDRCWNIIWPVAYAIAGDRSIAEDAAQEAVIRVIRNFDRFDDSRALEPWVRKIAANAAFTELRRQRKERSLDDEDVEEASSADYQETSDDEDVALAVATLPIEKRTVIVLHYWLDCPLREIAEILDLPLGTVASHLTRARDQIRLNLEEQHAGRAR